MDSPSPPIVVPRKIVDDLTDAQLDAASASAQEQSARLGLPFAESCEFNKYPIATALALLFSEVPRTAPYTVLEVGSGTAQHAAHLATTFAGIVDKWQLTEMPDELASTRRCFEHYAAPTNPIVHDRLLAPLKLNVAEAADWSCLAQSQAQPFNMVFTANTFHIMPWESVVRCLELVPSVMRQGGVLAVYGPFNYNGRFTTESNANFDGWLKRRNPLSGIRDFEVLCDIARAHGLHIVADFDMPSNNRLLAFVLRRS
jgi:hypothetical protein